GAIELLHRDGGELSRFAGGDVEQRWKDAEGQVAAQYPGREVVVTARDRKLHRSLELVGEVGHEWRHLFFEHRGIDGGREPDHQRWTIVDRWLGFGRRGVVVCGLRIRQEVETERDTARDNENHQHQE